MKPPLLSAYLERLEEAESMPWCDECQCYHSSAALHCYDVRERTWKLQCIR